MSEAETGPLGHVTSFYFDRCLVTVADGCTNTSCLLTTTKYVHYKSIRRLQPISFDQTHFPNFLEGNLAHNQEQYASAVLLKFQKPLELSFWSKLNSRALPFL